MVKICSGNMLYILLLLLPVLQSFSQSSDSEFIEIFDGKTLSGWKGDTTYWRVEDGKIVRMVTPETILERNSFLFGGVVL